MTGMTITTDHNLRTTYLDTLLKWLLVITATVCVPGCDPARRINMKNTSGHDVEIRWFIKEDSILNSPLFMNNATEVTFLLKPHQPYNLVRLSTGIGVWNAADFEAIINDLDSLVIQSHYGKIRLDSLQLKQFLWDRRMGLDKGKINIFISDKMTTASR